MLERKLLAASLAAATVLLLGACTADGRFAGFGSASASRAGTDQPGRTTGSMSSAPASQPTDMSDPGRENSTPSASETRSDRGTTGTAFPSGARNTAPD